MQAYLNAHPKKVTSLQNGSSDHSRWAAFYFSFFGIKFIAAMSWCNNACADTWLRTAHTHRCASQASVARLRRVVLLLFRPKWCRGST